LAPEVNSAMHRGVRHRKRYLHKDGRVVIAEVVVSPVRNDEGEVVQYVTQIADVTARVAADEALRREQRLLAESQAASHVGSWEFVPGRGGMWSDEMYRIFGLAPQSTPASFEAFLGHVHPSDVPALRELGRDPAVGEQDVDFRVVRSDGSIAWVATHARIERGPDGRPTRFVGTTLDITDRRRAEEERRKQMVQRKLVRRMLRDLVARGPASMTTRRDLGKALASEATSHDASGFVDAFAALNIGTLQVDRVGEGRYEARARDLLEVTPRFGSPTCHIALGFLEGMVAMLEEGTSLGAEVRCQSQGHEECLFVVKARPKP
jgi:PAS domain S-box-containing protein